MKLFRELWLVALISVLGFCKLSAQTGYSQTGMFSGIPELKSVPDFYDSRVFPLQLKDIGLIAGGTTEYGVKTGTYFNSLIFMKRLGNGFLRMRYTPGLGQSFSFRRSEGFYGSDSASISLNTNIDMQEVFALGYGYKFSEKFTAGVSVHQFTQKIKNDNFGAVIKPDTVYLVRETEEQSEGNYRLDVAGEYKFSPSFSLSGGVYSVTTLERGSLPADYKYTKLDYNRNYFLEAGFTARQYSFKLYSETRGFYEFSAGGTLPVFGGYAGAGISVTGETGNQTLIRSFTPALSFSAGFWQLILSATTFYPVPATTLPLTELSKHKIANFEHNRFSFNRVNLSLRSAITLRKERQAVITEAEVTGPLFPALYDLYTIQPVAVVKVVNTSDEKINIKPVIKFSRLSAESVYQQYTAVQPGDTAVIPIYFPVPDTFSSKNSSLAGLTIGVMTEREEVDDEITKTVLINGINAWDGNPEHLRFYVNKDIPYCSAAARELLSAAKNTMNMVPQVLQKFAALKVLFDKTLSSMQYVADPRASSETVQFPSETIKLKGGDCDDLSVCLASLLESSGIDCAFVVYHNAQGEGHINLLVNTGVPAAQAVMLNENDNFYVIRKNEIGTDEAWLPVETTRLTTFSEAWESAALKFKKEALDGFGLVNKTVEIFDIY